LPIFHSACAVSNYFCRLGSPHVVLWCLVGS
jgi:hypothetical protein